MVHDLNGGRHATRTCQVLWNGKVLGAVYGCKPNCCIQAQSWNLLISPYIGTTHTITPLISKNSNLSNNITVLLCTSLRIVQSQWHGLRSITTFCWPIQYTNTVELAYNEIQGAGQMCSIKPSCARYIQVVDSQA